MSLRMNRGRTSSLFRYLPGQTYNWQDRKGSFVGVDDVDTREMDIPRAWMKRALRRLVRPFGVAARSSGGSFPGLDIIEREQFELLEPKKLRGEFFPTTFVCLQCDRFHTGDNGRGSHCHCGGRLEQFSFVEFHQCGHLGGLTPPLCRNGCRAGMKLVNRESRSFADWNWRCARCGTVDRTVYRGCPVCRNGQVRVLRADANPVYYTQYVTVINPPGQAEYGLLDMDAVYPAAVAQALGALPPGLDGLRQGVNDRGTGAAREQARRQLIEEYGLEEDDPLLEQMLNRRQTRAESSLDWTSSVEALGLDSELIVELGYQCVELALAREASPVTIDRLIEEAPAATMRALYEVDYREALERYGFAEATLLREFPLAYVVAGYTRESKEPGPGVTFNFFRGTGQNVAMYGQRTETEAILFRLDPDRVLRWLIRSGVVDDPGDVNPQAWLFSVLQPVTSIFEPPDHRITAAVLGLVHSVAHRTLKAVAVRSGLATESLSEYLLPHNLAFLIYADTRSEFVLGGLEHVFRNYLAVSLRSMDEERRCVFDPPCRNDRGACAVCMYLSENSCARFNSALSRWYLFGGEGGGITWQAFWNA